MPGKAVVKEVANVFIDQTAKFGCYSETATKVSIIHLIKGLISLVSVIVTDNGSNIVPASCLQIEVDDDDNDDDDDDDGDDHEEFNESFSRIRNWINIRTRWCLLRWEG